MVLFDFISELFVIFDTIIKLFNIFPVNENNTTAEKISFFISKFLDIKHYLIF